MAPTYSMRRLIPGLLGVLLLGSVVACSSDAEVPEPTEVAGSDLLGVWGIVEVIDAKGGVSEDLSGLGTRRFDGVAAWIEFDATGAMAGEGPCNGFQGQYDVRDEVLKISDGRQQAAGCGDVVDAAEGRILGPLIATAPGFTMGRDGSSVVIRDGTTTLVLEPIGD